MSKNRLRNLKVSVQPTISELRFMAGRVMANPLSIMGVGILSFFALVALLAPVLAPPKGLDPYMIPRVSYAERPSPISEQHPFGTTQGQLDIFYGSVWGTRTAFRIGFVVVAISLAISIVVGSLAGYYGGLIDELLMRFTDIIIAFPGLVLAMALVTALPDTFAINLGFMNPTLYFTRLDKILLALVLVGWPGYTRVLRGEILRVKGEDFVEAAKAVGCSDFRIIIRHVMPNAVYPIVIMASLDIGSVVLTAAALSFLGIGAPHGYADWGQMISLARTWISDPAVLRSYWYTFIIPGIFIATFSLGWNLLGDAFRDILDPTIRRK